MPTLTLRLSPDLAAELHQVVAELRALAPKARITEASLVQHWIRLDLRKHHLAHAHVLLRQLAPHPRKRGAGLPAQLQDQVLAAIHRGPLRERLIAELDRAGEWESQISALARRWRQDGCTHEELCAAGRLGWVTAVQRWKPGPGWRSYAYMWIRKELERATRLGGSLLIESEHEARIRRLVEKAQRRGATEVGDIAAQTHLTPEQVERGMQGRRALGWKDLDGKKY